MSTLSTFKIEGRVTEIHPGPVVTMYEFEPAPGVRISKIAGLSDDLAMALKAFRVYRHTYSVRGLSALKYPTRAAKRSI